MGAYSGRMTDTVTVARPTGSRDDHGRRGPGSRVELVCNYEADGAVSRNTDGKITDTADKFATHGETQNGGTFEPDETTYVWPPGTDTNDPEQAIKPSAVQSASTPSTGQTVWEVTL